MYGQSLISFFEASLDLGTRLLVVWSVKFQKRTEKEHEASTAILKFHSKQDSKQGSKIFGRVLS